VETCIQCQKDLKKGHTHFLNASNIFTAYCFYFNHMSLKATSIMQR
jgi:hypothetical protein